MTENSPATLPKPQYTDLRLPSRLLVGRYDSLRGILQVQHKGVTYYFDLTQIEKPCYNGQHEQSKIYV